MIALNLYVWNVKKNREQTKDSSSHPTCFRRILKRQRFLEMKEVRFKKYGLSKLGIMCRS